MEVETATMWLQKIVFWFFLVVLQFVDLSEARYRGGSRYRSYRSYSYNYYYGTYYSGSGSGFNLTAAIVGGVIGGICLIALIVFVVYLRCKYVSSHRRTSPAFVLADEPAVKLHKRNAKVKIEKVIVPRKKKDELPPLPGPPAGFSPGQQPPNGQPPTAPPSYDSVYPPSKVEGGSGVYPPPQPQNVPTAFTYNPPY